MIMARLQRFNPSGVLPKSSANNSHQTTEHTEYTEKAVFPCIPCAPWFHPLSMLARLLQPLDLWLGQALRCGLKAPRLDDQSPILDTQFSINRFIEN